MLQFISEVTSMTEEVLYSSRARNCRQLDILHRLDGLYDIVFPNQFKTIWFMSLNIVCLLSPVSFVGMLW